MHKEISELNTSELNAIVRMGWEDRTSFEVIEEKTGLNEAAVIRVMRSELKPRSFRLWRERVTGRITKHRKRFKRRDGPRVPDAAEFNRRIR
jgi:uncharacterized protein (TIGR03643 family)